MNQNNETDANVVDNVNKEKGLIRRYIGSFFSVIREYASSYIGAIALSAIVIVYLSVSIVFIDKGKVGHLIKIVGKDPKDSTSIIVSKDEKGKQAEVLGPGMHFKHFFGFWYDVEEFPLTVIKPNQFGILIAQDGIPLEEGQIVANSWEAGEFENMLNAEYFLKNKGQRGVQLSILLPGSYRLNRYLFNVQMEDIITIDPGFVGVVRSSVNENKNCNQFKNSNVVEKGCSGIWNQPLLPKRYALNPFAYQISKISTKEHSLNFLGGYKRRAINLIDAGDGGGKSEVTEIDVPVPDDAVEKAIRTRVEGWVVPLELRVVTKILPEHAPYVVSGIGDLSAVETNVIIPIIKSIVRDRVQTMKVFDVVENRSQLKKLVEDIVVPEAKKHYVTVIDLRFGDPVLPPELLTAKRREQLATQLTETYRREEMAQVQRVKSEHARTLANNQNKLAVAEVAKQAMVLKGEGKRIQMQQISLALKERTEILGEKSALQLAIVEKVLDSAVNNPEIVKIPSVLVQGAEGFEGAAAVLGSGSIWKLFNDIKVGKTSLQQNSESDKP